MTRIEAKDKIKKLLNLAKDHGATTNEAKVALNKAKALADKYEIAIRFADGSVYGASKVETKQEANMHTVMFTTKHWNKHLVHVVAKLFNLNVFVDNKNHVMYIKGISLEKFNYIKTFYEEAIKIQCRDLQKIKADRVSYGAEWRRKDSINFSKDWYNNIIVWYNCKSNDDESYEKAVMRLFPSLISFVEYNRKKIERYSKEA